MFMGKTGACCDPENKEGLSHLLEHTLFGLRKSANISHIYSSIINSQLNIKAFTRLNIPHLLLSQ
ncbi:MAG: hypothetical protein CM15mP117_16360 [Alphaproteobacteria bacterium]|nr:MAG: hypothetical protein CM15mP117_16360 [Alphaproteobacteria bacterium]